MKWSWENGTLVLRTTRISTRGPAGAFIARITPTLHAFSVSYSSPYWLSRGEIMVGPFAECLRALQAHVPYLPAVPQDTSPWCTRIGGHLPLGCCCWTRTCDTDPMQIDANEKLKKLKEVLPPERVQWLSDFLNSPQVRQMQADALTRSFAMAKARRSTRAAEDTAALEAHHGRAGRYAWMEPLGTTLLKAAPTDGGRVIVVHYDGNPMDALVGFNGVAHARSAAFHFDNGNTHGWYPFEDYPKLAARYVDIVQGRGESWRLRADGPLFRGAL